MSKKDKTIYKLLKENTELKSELEDKIEWNAILLEQLLEKQIKLTAFQEAAITAFGPILVKETSPVKQSFIENMEQAVEEGEQ